jgi:hypothetical protein
MKTTRAVDGILIGNTSIHQMHTGSHQKNGIPVFLVVSRFSFISL